MAAASAVPVLRTIATRLFDAKTGPGPRPSAVIRTRVIDDAIVDIVKRHNDSQVVILAAGFDTRAYRLSALAKARVFELDHPGDPARETRSD
jgi:O-methyltransferase involved in polyketide biosynthesis